MKAASILRQAQEVLVKSASGKRTGLTGIYEHPHPRPALITIYKATLTNLREKFPASSVYRQSAEKLTQERLGIVESTESHREIEDKIGCGLIEEVVLQANDEHELANKLAEWKCWDDLEEVPLEDQWVYFGRKV